MTYYPLYVTQQNFDRVQNDTWQLSFILSDLLGVGTYHIRIASDINQDAIIEDTGTFDEASRELTFTISETLTGIRRKAYLYEIQFKKIVDSSTNETITLYRGVLTVL